MKKVFDQYIFLSFITVLLTIFTYQSIAAEIDYIYSLLVGLATLILYNFHPYLFSFDALSGNTFKKWLLLPLLIFVLLFTASAINFKIYSWMLLVFSGVLCIGYFMKFTKSNLRSHFLTKPLTIGLVFGICTATVPYLQSGYLISESLFLSLGRIFFITTLAFIFDIGDFVQDNLEKTLTFPNKWGINKAKLFCIGLLVLAGVIEMWGAWIFLIDINGLVALSMTYMITLVAIYFANPQRSWWYYEVFIDGIMALPLIIFLLL